jgi:hypothetical protein
MGLVYVRCMHGQGSAYCPTRLYSYTTHSHITYLLHKGAATRTHRHPDTITAHTNAPSDPEPSAWPGHGLV